MISTSPRVGVCWSPLGQTDWIGWVCWVWPMPLWSVMLEPVTVGSKHSGIARGDDATTIRMSPTNTAKLAAVARMMLRKLRNRTYSSSDAS